MTNIDVLEIGADVVVEQSKPFIELAELQLALVGGGCGDVVFG